MKISTTVLISKVTLKPHQLKITIYFITTLGEHLGHGPKYKAAEWS